MNSFVAFMAHHCFAHPDVRRDVKKYGRLPQEFSFRFREFEPGTPPTEFEVRYVLKSVANTPSREVMLVSSEHERSYEQFDENLRQILTRFEESRIPRQTVLKAETLQLVQQFLQDDKAAAALMAAFRYREITGDDRGYAEICKPLLKSSDRLLNKFWAGRFRRADFEKLVETVEVQNSELTAVAEYLLADSAMNENWDLDVGSALISALKKDPLLSGAYLDLGRFYNANFMMVEGWTCFEFSRIIAPQHPNLLVIDDLMKSLETDFADFF